MVIRTNLHPRDYSEKEVCRIVNQKQVKLYTKARVYPMHMYPSLGKDGNDIVVYIYLKEETKELYQQWLARELT